MPRIRTIKPEMFQDEKLAPLAAHHRFVFMGLVSMADDAGRLLDNVKIVDAFIFPVTKETSRASLDILANLSRIVRYTSASGQQLIQISNWSKHQRVDHPNAYVLPAPTAEDVAASEDTAIRESLASHSREPRENLAIRSTTNDQRPTTDEHARVSLSRKGDDPRVAEVIAHYLEFHPLRRPGEKERRVIWRALEELGYSVDDLKRAITGNASSEFHVREGFTGLTLTLRDNEHIDKFRLMPEPEPYYDEAKYGPMVNAFGVMSDRFDLMTNPDRAAEWAREQRKRA